LSILFSCLAQLLSSKNEEILHTNRQIYPFGKFSVLLVSGARANGLKI
jgi:hypothetical protein